MHPMDKIGYIILVLLFQVYKTAQNSTNLSASRNSSSQIGKFFDHTGISSEDSLFSKYANNLETQSLVEEKKLKRQNNLISKDKLKKSRKRKRKRKRKNKLTRNKHQNSTINSMKRRQMQRTKELPMDGKNDRKVSKLLTNQRHSVHSKKTLRNKNDHLSKLSRSIFPQTYMNNVFSQPYARNSLNWIRSLREEHENFASTLRDRFLNKRFGESNHNIVNKFNDHRFPAPRSFLPNLPSFHGSKSGYVPKRWKKNFKGFGKRKGRGPKKRIWRKHEKTLNRPSFSSTENSIFIKKTRRFDSNNVNSDFALNPPKRRWNIGLDSTHSVKFNKKHYNHKTIIPTLHTPNPRTKSLYTPYGNDIFKNKPYDVRNKDTGTEDWEWVNSGKPTNEVTYNKPKESDAGYKETFPEGSHDSEDFFKNCLQCPSKKIVEAQKGLDWVPLFVPKPKDICHKRNPLKYHVEISPSSMKLGFPLKEGHYYINVSILGGTDGKTNLKSCIYDYEVQVFKCPELSHVPNGQMECTAGRAWGSMCRWKCNPGKKLSGLSFASCGGAKDAPRWSHKPPTCEDAGCPNPKNIEGMTVSCSRPFVYSYQNANIYLGTYPFGSICKVRCHSGYSPRSPLYSRGVTIVKCLSTGEWSPKIEKCCTKQRIMPPPIFRDCLDISIQLRDKPVYLLPPKYNSLNGIPAHVYCDKNSVRTTGRHCRICRAQDEIRRMTAACRQCINVTKREECPSIRPPKNGELMCTDGPGKGEECSVICKDGYMLPRFISSGKIFCQDGSSLWNFQSYKYEKLPDCVLR